METNKDTKELITLISALGIISIIAERKLDRVTNADE
jgi:hypothetical protein